MHKRDVQELEYQTWNGSVAIKSYRGNNHKKYNLFSFLLVK